MWEQVENTKVFTHPKHPDYRVVLDEDTACLEYLNPSVGWTQMDSRDGGDIALQRLCQNFNSLHTLPCEAEFLDLAYKAYGPA
jgi:hypothetical protein